jgi:hypothetical protein
MDQDIAGGSGAEPPAAPQAAAGPDVAGEEPQAPDESAIDSAFKDLTDDQLFALLDGVMPEGVDEPEQAEAPAREGTEQAPEGESGEEPPPEEPPPEHGEADTTRPTMPQRVSLRGLPEDQRKQVLAAMDLVRNGTAKTMNDAFGLLAGKSEGGKGGEPEAPDDSAAQAAPEEGDETPPEVVEIKEKLAALKEERHKTNQAYDPEATLALTEQIEDLNIALLKAETAADERRERAGRYDAEYEAAVDAVEAKYPEAADENSAFNRVLDDKVTAALARKDPAVTDPRFILRFADEVAELLAIGAKARGTATKAQPAPPPARAARPVGSTVAPGQNSAAPIGPKELAKLLDSATDEELKGLEQLVFTK